MYSQIKIYLNIVFLLITIFLIECDSQKGTIVFTFDDDNVEDWHNSRDLFNQYKIRATFFITRPHKLDSLQIAMLHALQKDGHEIGCHTLTHKNAVRYCDTSSIENYIQKEVITANRILTQNGFELTSFAYPNGQSTPEMDSALLHYFKILRKATYNIEDTTIDCIDRTYSDGSSGIIDAMGIDVAYKITTENFETGLKRISQSGEALIVHAHEIDDSAGNFSLSRDYLEQVFKLCETYHVRSITCAELSKKNK